MKKIYIIPTVTTLEVETCEMIAASDFDEALGTTGSNGNTALDREVDMFFDSENDF